MMKKLLAFTLMLALCVLSLTACPAPADEGLTVRVAGMTGPTSLGLVKLAEDSEAGLTQNTYAFDMTYAAADQIMPGLIQGTLDMAALPANVAASLYQNTNGAIQVLAINTLGVVNIVEKGNTVTSLADLVGKKIYAVGRGTTPEYGLRYLLSEHDIDFDALDIEWFSKATDILPRLKTEENAIAMIPQPFATAATLQVEGLRIALDLNEVWQALGKGSSFVTGVMVARRAFIEQHPEAVATFLAEYATSIAYAKDHPSETAPLAVKYGIIAQEGLARQALPKCNLTFLSGETMKYRLADYLGTLYALNPDAVGGAMPSDDFYYVP